MRTSFYPLDVSSTVAEMYRLADEYRSDVAGLGWRTIEDVFRGVGAIPYRTDEDAAECQGAVECLKRPGITAGLGGDCDDKTILAGAALSFIGVPWRIVTVAYEGGELSHVYLEVLVSGVWRPFDATSGELSLYEENPYTQKLIWQR